MWGVVRRMDFFEGFPRCLSTFWCGSISIEVRRDRWCTWCPCNGWSDTCKDDYGCKFRLGGTKLQKTGIRSLVLADLIAIARLPSSDKIFSPCFPLHLFLGKIAKFNKRPPVLSGQGEDTKNLGVYHLISFNNQPTGVEERFQPIPLAVRTPCSISSDKIVCFLVIDVIHCIQPEVEKVMALDRSDSLWCLTVANLHWQCLSIISDSLSWPMWNPHCGWP